MIEDRHKHLYHWNEDGTPKLNKRGNHMRKRYKKGKNDDPDQIFEKEVRGKYIDSPETLELWFKEYIKYLNDNPFLVHSVNSSGEDVYTKREKPIILEGFYSWMKLEKKVHVRSYMDNERGYYEDYKEVASAIKNYIRDNHIMGGYVGIFNASLVQRVQGLVDKTETKTESNVQGKTTINFRK